MTLFMRRFRKNQESGAVAVEFALMAPLIFLVLMLLIDFSRLGYVHISLNSAAREVVRAASFGETSQTNLETIADSSSGGAAGMAQLSPNAKLSVTTTASCSTPSTQIRTTDIEVSTTFSWITPIEFFNLVEGKSSVYQNMKVKARGVMVCTG